MSLPVGKKNSRDVIVAALTVSANLALTPPAFQSEPLLGHFAPPSWLIIVIAVAGAVPLCWRTSAPLRVFTLVWLLALPVLFLVGDYRPVLVLLVAMFAGVRAGTSRQALLMLAASVFAFTPVVLVEVRDTGQIISSMTFLIGVTIYLSVVTTVWIAARWAGKSGRRLWEVERQRDAAAAQAVADERRRIARELHDSVAHSISLITIQAAGAHSVLRYDPDRAESALNAIDELGRQTVDELQRLLGVLRTEAPNLLGDPAATAASSVGQPSLALFDEVLANMTDAGLTLTTDVVGTPGHLDPSVDSAAFRVVQESLTNVLKHAGPGATTDVKRIWAPDRLILEITNSVPVSQRSSTGNDGHGLLGMRERAVSVGGGFNAGRVAGNRFRVTAWLPRPRTEVTIP